MTAAGNITLDADFIMTLGNIDIDGVANAAAAGTASAFAYYDGLKTASIRALPRK